MAKSNSTRSYMTDGAAFAQHYLRLLNKDPSSVTLEGWIDDMSDQSQEQKDAFSEVLQTALARKLPKLDSVEPAATPKNAEPSESSPGLADSFDQIMYPAFKIKAMLQGALALLEDAGMDDADGKVWAAREIIEVACMTTDNFTGDAVYDFGKRLKVLEGGAA